MFVKMLCPHVFASMTSLLIITHCPNTKAQSQGDTLFPGEIKARRGQVEDHTRTTAIPFSISSQTDGCRDSFLAEQCNSWKETIGCTESNMRVGCKKTCNLCQTQGPSTQLLNLQPGPSTRPPVSLAPHWFQTQAPPPTCSDEADTSLCNNWKIEFGCTQLSVSTYCRKTCGLCSGFSSHTPANQGNQVISLQPQPTAVPQNTGILIINHNPAKPAQNNNLPLGPSSINLQATNRPLLTSPPATVRTSPPIPFSSTSISLQATKKPQVTNPPGTIATSPPLPLGNRNVGINLFGGETTTSTATARPIEIVSSTNEPSSPVVQPMIPLNISDMITNPGVKPNQTIPIPESWRGDKSKLPFGNSPLIVAVRNQNAEHVRTLIQNGATINHQDHYGMTALMWIAGSGNNQILDLLLQARASPNLTDFLGSSALMIAAFNDHDETVEKLLDAGAYVDAQDSFGETALMSAARNGHYYTVDILLKSDAQVSLQDNQGMTALHHAALKQCVQCVEKLVRKCPDIKLKNNIGETPLDIAKEKGNSKIITLIEGLIQPSCIHAGETFLAGTLRVESCIELECKCGGYYEPTGNNDLACLVLNGLL